MPTLASTRETDAALIARSVAQPAVFGELFDRHWPRIHRYCAGRAGAVGEDLAAEVFRIAFDGRHDYRAEYEDARPWLFGVATNLLRAHFRGLERAERFLAGAQAGAEDDHADAALGRVEAERMAPALAAALAATAEAEREALLLHVWADLTYPEIAAATGVPVGTVRSRIHRARTRLRAHLTKETT